jgi:hypothetical protein
VFATRNAFWVSAGLAALSACSPSRANLPPVNTGSEAPRPPLPAAQADSKKIEIRTQRGATYSASFDVDGTVAPGAHPTDIKIVAELEGTLLIVDTYASLPGGMSYCQAGEESFLRVVSTVSGVPEETTRIKLSSCRQNIELGSPGLEWQPGSSTLQLRWLSGPGTRGVPAQLTLRIGAS